jgi:hypothetical protein
MSGLPGTTNDKPDAMHCEPLAGRPRIELRTCARLSPARSLDRIEITRFPSAH